MPNLVHIDTDAHPALAPYTSVRERDLAGREGLFVAEGEVVLRVLAFQSPLTVRSVLLEKRRIDAVLDVVTELPHTVPVYVVPQRVMDRVVGFSIHRGVLALGERGPAADPARLVAGAPLVVGLVGLTNHDNVGGVFRNAAAFGASAVLLDDATCDPLYRKAIRVSAGAALTVPFARCGSGEAMLDLLAATGIEPFALTPRGDEGVEALASGSEPRALILGAEGVGLPDSVLARARRVRIDMTAGFDSLNVAVASGIALHEAKRGRGA
jgi:tRNA G18 (ribose-2'-O)-methylase SpoU